LPSRVPQRDGSILAQTGRSQSWVHDGVTFFIRDGRLTLDIGWVGVHAGRRRVADDKWHDVAVSYAAETGEIVFFYHDQDFRMPEGRNTRIRTRYFFQIINNQWQRGIPESWRTEDDEPADTVTTFRIPASDDKFMLPTVRLEMVREISSKFVELLPSVK